MILITIGLMCLLELKKKQQDKNRKNSAEKFCLIKNVFYCCFKTKKTCFKTSSHLTLSPSITPSLFHSKLKTYLFGKSFPP